MKDNEFKPPDWMLLKEDDTIPGSCEAIFQGCICDTQEEHHTYGYVAYRVDNKCPVHGGKVGIMPIYWLYK